MELFLLLLFFYSSFSALRFPGVLGMSRASKKKTKKKGLCLSQIHPMGWICSGERGPPPASQLFIPNPGENLGLGIWTL